MNRKTSLSALIFLFTLLTSYSPLLAATYPPEGNPEYNLNVRTFDAKNGALNLISFLHDLDSAPVLCTLIEGVAKPGVTSLKQIHEYDWNNNRPADGYVSVSPAPSDYASLVGFTTTPGQNILVPESPYDIGDGKEIMVLYASPNQITIRYAVQDDVLVGYTIHILGLNVRPEVLNLYNELNSAGRKELPALGENEILGTAAGGEILVSVRDSGAFMDARWREDWWNCSTAATANYALPGKLLVGIGGGGGIGPNLPPSACDPKNNGDLYSRPVPCQACNTTGKLTTSCTESFKVTDELKFRTCEAGVSCEGKDNLVKLPWGGMININASGVTIPFVGYRDARSKPEDSYLADYFDGSSGYYEKSNYERYWLDNVNYSGVLRKLTPMAYQDGLKTQMIKRVMTSLADPSNTAKENKVHDYKINYAGRICWDAPFWLDAVTAIIKRLGGNLTQKMDFAHYCLYETTAINGGKVLIVKSLLYSFNAISPFKIPTRYNSGGKTSVSFLDGKLPPSPNDPDYGKKWDEWKYNTAGQLTDAGKYWEVVPMTSREDTEGKILPYIAAYPEDKLTVQDKSSQVEMVPHLARLYESSKIVDRALLPFPKSVVSAQDTNNNLLSVAEVAPQPTTVPGKTLLASKTLIAASNCNASVEPPTLSIGLTVGPSGAGETRIDWSVCTGTVGHEPACGIRDFNLAFSSSVGQAPASFGPGDGMGLMVGQCFTTGMGGAGPFYVPDGTTVVTVKVVANGERDPGECVACPKSVAATCTLDLAKKTSTCGVITQPPLSCKWNDPAKIDGCIKNEAITDKNPNDALCCTKTIQAKLEAQEQFYNTDYASCEQPICCGYDTYGQPYCKDVQACLPELCNAQSGFPSWVSEPFYCATRPGSNKIITRPVSREVGVTLLHPYLSQIYNQTAGPSGVFNNFRPPEIPKFPQTPAYSQIGVTYNYQPDPRSIDGSTSNGSAQPGSGKFYFPYIGGVQQAKVWLINALRMSDVKHQGYK